VVIFKSLVSQGIFEIVKKVRERIGAFRSRFSRLADQSSSAIEQPAQKQRLKGVCEVIIKVAIAIGVHFATAECLVGLFNGSRRA
jgi:hypothetical protein